MQEATATSQSTSPSRFEQQACPAEEVDLRSAEKAPQSRIEDVTRELKHVLAKPMSLELDNAPCYFPYQAQHLVLTTTQRLLEESCFAFLVRCLPDLIRDRKWECAAVLELHNWLEILVDPQWKAFIEPNLARPFATGVLHDVRTIRHAAVYRTPTTASAVGQLVQSAVQFAGFLQDNRCLSQLEQLRSGLHIQIRQMEKTKREANLAMIKKLDGLLEQRKYAILGQKRLFEEVKAEAGRQVGELVDRVCGRQENVNNNECVTKEMVYDASSRTFPESGLVA
ncbi:hypothetical protein EDB81DRAFT_824497 [Dactylonectria macrodidyma]|uniref:Uncharacterized protein n=1 Tax=Dactylonectria macrodidyma TaxID=307937 RepID=A0A9P9D6M7_9HYPO|nr:hypothetical protein EDB81DRAFT_824497 [Dactylonectria macrodidyma]